MAEQFPNVGRVKWQRMCRRSEDLQLKLRRPDLTGLMEAKWRSELRHLVAHIRAISHLPYRTEPSK